MPNNNFPILTPEERVAAKQAAQEKRERAIQSAIQNGASVKYLTTHLTSEEYETHIYWDNMGNTIIDTTIPKDITKLIKRGWQITSITYYKDANIIAGMIFKGKSNGVSLKNLNKAVNEANDQIELDG